MATKAKSKAPAKKSVPVVRNGKNAGKGSTRSSGSGSVNVNTVHVYQAPKAKIGESVLFFPGQHDPIFDSELEMFSATVSNALADGKVNLHVFNDGPERAYRTNIAHRSLAEPGASYWEWVDSI